jgi:hypothetical protein
MDWLFWFIKVSSMFSQGFLKIEEGEPTNKGKSRTSWFHWGIKPQFKEELTLILFKLLQEMQRQDS